MPASSTIQKKGPGRLESVPLLLVAYFVLHGLQENRGLLPIIPSLIIGCKYAAIGALLMLSCYWFLHSWRKAALASFVLLFLLLYFGNLLHAAQSIPWIGGKIHYAIILPALAIILLYFLYRLRRSSRTFLRIVQYLYWAIIVLIVVDAALYLRGSLRPDTMLRTPMIIPHVAVEEKPDVYLVVADEYAGHTELNDVFHFNNQPFEDSLRKLGFEVNADARSNYNNTEYSIASCLNGSLLDVKPVTNARDVARCFAAVQTNSVSKYFEGLGYQPYNLSIFNMGASDAFATDAFHIQNTGLLTRETFIARAKRDIGFHLAPEKTKEEERLSVYAYQRNTVRQLAALKHVAGERNGPPRFVYAHFDLPHSPFYFTKEGKANPPELLSFRHKTDTSLYVGYLQYANGIYLDLLRRLRTNPRPAIIIFMGDHGFRGFDNKIADFYYTNTIRAVALPKGLPFKGNEVSHVNLFRSLLNQEFGQSLPLVRDSSYFIRSH